MAPLVSVVLPTYNRASTLERAIESVLNQTFTDFELIVIDDRSTDKTRLILSKYAGLNNVRLVSQLRRGCSVARNIGVSISQGRYVAFQDSDDEWVLDKLAKAVAVLEGVGPEIGVFYSDMLRVHTDGTSADFRSPDVELGVLVDESSLDYQVSSVGIQSAVIKRECFEEVGYFDEALPRLIDLELFIRLSDRYRFVHCKERLVKYYAVEGISTDRQALVTARRYVLRKYYSRLRRQKHHLANQYLHLAGALWLNGEKSSSLAFLLKALLTSPGHGGVRNKLFQRVLRTGQEALARYRIYNTRIQRRS